MSRSAQLTIYGYTADTTSYAGNKAIITYNANAASAGSNDASGTLRVAATNFKLYNVNVINSCKSAPHDVGPRLLLHGDGRGTTSRSEAQSNCRLNVCCSHN